MTTTNEREQRGLVIAATSRITRKGNVWLVPAQSGKGKYTVSPDKEHPHCTCPDHEERGCECKHIYAVRFVIQRELFDDGSEIETRQLTITETRKTYPQNWPAYNAAQVNEKETFQSLLRDLVQAIPEPDVVRRRGNQPFPIRDAIFAACFKVYSTVSGRRFMCDLNDAHDKGFIGRVPSYNMIFKVFDQPETFDILKSLVLRSAEPLKSIETKFACDSSGFSGCRFDRWFDQKYGPTFKKVLRAWVKCHVMCGVKTNVVTAVEIHDQWANDGVQLKPLLDTTARRFEISEVSADLAYSTKANLEAISSLGAAPMIPFRKNASPATGGLWAKMYHFFNLQRDEFLNRYHLRSNVESTFSMIKAKFGDGCRSKCDTAMKNEVLAKLVCHNVCCVIQAVHELGVNPTFWRGEATATSCA